MTVTVPLHSHMQILPFTIHHYGKATVVFDGYSEGPSIKNNMHQRGSQGAAVALMDRASDL